MKKYMIDQGGEAAALTPEEFSAHLSSEIVKWTRVVDKANIRPNWVRGRGALILQGKTPWGAALAKTDHQIEGLAVQGVSSVVLEGVGEVKRAGVGHDGVSHIFDEVKY